MSEITLCLITKGRPEFLRPLLQSLERVIKHKNVHIYVVLNGVESKVSTIFQDWGEIHSGRVKFLQFVDNDPDISRMWNEVISLKTEWVMFPSDDDVINDAFFNDLDFLESLPLKIGAVATPLRLIDSKGIESGLTRRPAFSANSSRAENVAKAFSQSPFLWPGLIARVSALPRRIPSARYVADWWIGLYLILSTGIEVRDNSAIFYRVHEKQESFAATSSRKNLEAITHLGDITKSTTFADWLNGCEALEVLEFLRLIRKYPPLYGEIKFSSELVSVITSRVIEMRSEALVHQNALFTHAYAHDVLIHDSQLKFFFSKPAPQDLERDEYNFKFKLLDQVCQKMKDTLSASKDVSKEPFLNVGCNHTSRFKTQIRLDCERFELKSDLIDQLLLQSAAYFQSEEVFQNVVSPFEYRLIKKFRSSKQLIPRYLIVLLQKIKNN
jgi:hypothetical protein